jgi:hypothetical protein
MWCAIAATDRLAYYYLLYPLVAAVAFHQPKASSVMKGYYPAQKEVELHVPAGVPSSVQSCCNDKNNLTTSSKTSCCSISIVQTRTSFTSNGQRLKFTSHQALNVQAICHISKELAAIPASSHEHH